MKLLQRLKALLEDETVKTLLGRGFAALSIKVGAAGLSFAMFVLISNAMDAAEYGRFAIGFSLAITLSAVAGLGLGTAVLRFYPQYMASSQPRLAHGFMRLMINCSLGLPLAFAGLCALVLFLYSSAFPGTNTAYLYASLALLPVMAFSETLASTLRAFGYTIMSLAPRDIAWRAIACVGALAVVWRASRVGSATMLWFLAATLLVVIAWQAFSARKDFAPIFAEDAPQRDIPTWRMAVWPMWGAATLYAFAQQFDVVVIGFFMTPADSAPYFAALRTANMLSLLLIAGNLISAPMISRHYYAGDMKSLQKLIRLMTAGIAIPTLLGFGFLALVGGYLLGFFNPAFVSAYPIMLILGLGFTFDAIAGPTGYMLQMIGHEKTYLKIMAGTYVCTLLLQCALIPYFGAYGAAVPSALGLIAANLFIIHKVRRILGIDPSLFGLFSKAHLHV